MNNNVVKRSRWQLLRWRVLRAILSDVIDACKQCSGPRVKRGVIAIREISTPLCKGGLKHDRGDSFLAPAR